MMMTQRNDLDKYHHHHYRDENYDHLMIIIIIVIVVVACSFFSWLLCLGAGAGWEDGDMRCIAAGRVREVFRRRVCRRPQRIRETRPHPASSGQDHCSMPQADRGTKR